VEVASRSLGRLNFWELPSRNTLHHRSTAVVEERITSWLEQSLDYADHAVAHAMMLDLITHLFSSADAETAE
jgi:hypothetical protein